MSFAFGVFDAAVYYGALPELDVRIVSGEPDAAIRGGGLAYDVPYDLSAIREADLVIVPLLAGSGRTAAGAAAGIPAPRARRGARVAGLCSGVFVLAAAGLLDERPATTPGRLQGCSPRCAQRSPSARRSSTSTTVTSSPPVVVPLGWTWACIWSGPLMVRLANRLARSIVVPPHRPGGRRSTSSRRYPNWNQDDPVGETMNWALGQLDQILPIDVLARRAQMSRRNFDRRFRELTGTAPATWLTHQRVLRAQRLLESTRLSVGGGSAILRILLGRSPAPPLPATRGSRSGHIPRHLWRRS